MPVEFLSDDEVARFGRYQEDPSRRDLERFFFLDDADLLLVDRRRADHVRLGFALQLTTVRFLGTFLSDPLDAPWQVVDYLAVQLGVEDPSVVKRYTERAALRWEHAAEIRTELGLHDFADAEAPLREFLEGRAWTHAEGPRHLFDQAVAWLRHHRVLLPGASVLARLVAAVRRGAADRLYGMIAEAAAGADPELPERLRRLLAVPVGARYSELERLRRPPRKISGRAMTEALHRAEDVLGIGARKAQVQAVPTNRLKQLARYGLTSKAPLIAQLAEPRQTATLLAAARALEEHAVDDALDLFHVLMATRLISAAKREVTSGRLESLPRLERASTTLAASTRAFVEFLESAEDTVSVTQVWAAVEQVASRAEVVGAADVVVELVPDDSAGETAMRQRLAGKYQSVRPFLILLAEALPLGSTPAAAGLLAEVRRLPELARRRVSQKPLREAEVNEDLVPRLWHRAVFANAALLPGEVDRDAYVLCILESLHRALRRRDVFASPSNRWADPRAQLLDGAEWILVRDEVLTALGLTGGVEAHLAEVCAELDAGWQQLADRIAEAGAGAGVRIEEDAEGRMRLAVSRLDAVAEPASQGALRSAVAAMLPRVDLPELLLEVHAWTGCLDEFTNVSGSATRLEGLHITAAALLVAEACNVGLTPVTKAGDPALTRDRLSHVAQNYLRAETFSAANARLIEAQGAIATAALWGGGLVASVDGLRFAVPVATINAAPNPKYFGRGRGLTWLNAMNDQFSGIGATVVPGTVRDSLYVLDTLLNLDAGPDPEMVTSDTASYSDMVFGMFRLLGYRFAPRIADLADQRLWRAPGPDGLDGDYGPLNAIARHKVNLARIRTRWSDMVRVAGSLVDGRVRAYDLLRMLSREGNPIPLGQAFAEYGRIAKTVHLLALIDPVDETYRRQIGRQQNMTESRHQLARRIYHGQRGQMYKSYREGQEDQLGALGLVLNAVVLWNTRYIDAALAELRGRGEPANIEDAARLTPLGFEHINMLGRYAFTPPAGTGLRPLRDPAADGEE
jgi:TnpA family transposase